MKKVMFILVGFLLSFSVSAATLTLTGGSGMNTAPGETVNTVSLGNAGLIEWALTSDEDTTVTVAATFNPDTMATLSIFDSSNTLIRSASAISIDGGNTSTLFFYAALIKDTLYSLVISEVANLTTATVSAVPIPAALWLFAPALAGLFGFRRKAAVAA